MHFFFQIPLEIIFENHFKSHLENTTNTAWKTITRSHKILYLFSEIQWETISECGTENHSQSHKALNLFSKFFGKSFPNHSIFSSNHFENYLKSHTKNQLETQPRQLLCLAKPCVWTVPKTTPWECLSSRVFRPTYDDNPCKTPKNKNEEAKTPSGYKTHLEQQHKDQNKGLETSFNHKTRLARTWSSATEV